MKQRKEWRKPQKGIVEKINEINGWLTGIWYLNQVGIYQSNLSMDSSTKNIQSSIHGLILSK